MFGINEVYAGVISDAPPISSILESALMLVLSIVGTLAILGCVIAGVMYMTAGGDSQRTESAKKALTGSIIGLAVAILAFVIVKTIVYLV